MTNNFRETANFIWSVRDLIRDSYKRHKHAEIILPFTVLRRLDCVLEPTKKDVLAKHEQYKKKLDDTSGILRKASGYSFYNTSKFDFHKLLDEPTSIKQNTFDYINGFSENIRDIVDKFKLREKIADLDEKDLLYQLIQRYSEIDLHPDRISNHEMGYIFEELIRKSNELSNENPGEHFTPREIIRLMVNLLLSKDRRELSKEGKIVTVYDPACGTGGMLTIAKEHILSDINKKAKVEIFGQEINDETFAICKSDMLIKGENADNIKYGSSFSRDGLQKNSFDYIFSNPPFGKEWKQDETFISDEYERGFSGRFGAGLPRINDGQLLFIQHMLSKMHKNGEPTRIAIVFNGSPLFTGDAGSGESEIRRWIIENDWLEAIVAMPDQLFYNTGIFTYVWILTNKKEASRRGTITLINATDLFVKMRKSLGDKRNEISDDQIKEIARMYFENRNHGRVKIFRSTEFAYRKVTVERPLKLNFQASEERIVRLDEQKVFANLGSSKKTKNAQAKLLEEKEGKALRSAIKKAVRQIGDKLFKNASVFEEELDRVLEKEGVRLDAPLRKAILEALSERDETADIVSASKIERLSDPELRDHEKVPFDEDINVYFKREVLPHVPDAWINEKVKDEKDGKIGKVGYEINFNKYFYQYKPPRQLEDIESDMNKLQAEILKFLGEVTK